jgi:hypothetical protein
VVGVVVVERSGSKQIAQYLLAVRPVLAHAIAGREAWVRSIGVLMEDARKGHRMVVTRDAVRVGRERLRQFEECRERLAGLWPPAACITCHRAATAWLDQLIAVCQLLEEVGRSGDLSRLRYVDDMLCESRTNARKFNTEYARLSDQLRLLVAAARISTRPVGLGGMRTALAS